MSRYRPNSFDARGFFFGFSFLIVSVAILCGAIKYGTVLAQEHFGQESQTALAAETMPESPPVVEYEPVQEQTGPSVFTARKPVPRVSAKAFVVGDVESGAIFAQKDLTRAYAIASVTKLLTALTATELLSATSSVSINAGDRRKTEGTPGSITVDESFGRDDILHALLMESNNSAAYALARAAGESFFMQELRKNAKEAGMTTATFEDPSGISKHNIASALDLFMLTRHLHHSAPDIVAITREQNKTIAAKSGHKYGLGNFNVFAGNSRFIGGKTGYTDDARQTMTTIFQVPVDDETATIAIVVLGSEDRKKDVEALRAWFTSAAEVATSSANF